MFTGVRRRGAKMLVGLELLLLTVAMAATEVENPVLLGTCVLAGTLLLACSAYIAAGGGGAAAVMVVIGGFFVLMFRLVRKIESMEKLAKRFESRLHVLTRGLSEDALGPKGRKPLSVARQTTTDLSRLMADAAALKGDFERVIIEPVSLFGLTKCGLKGRERAVEKARLDYAGDCSRITDLLRGCVICPSDDKQMEHILRCYNALDRLQLDGEITIVEIKNRIRDGATATGYVDMNFRIDFRGHLCEFQILDQVMFDLKNEMHSSFELCRSFNLIGPLPCVSTRRPSAVMRSVSLAERLSLGFLRFLVGVFAAMVVTVYLVFLFYPGLAFVLPGEPLVFKLGFGFALAAPFSITSFLACSDLLRGAPYGRSRAVACSVVAVAGGNCVFFGVYSGDPTILSIFCGVAAVYLLHVTAALVAVRHSGCSAVCGGRRTGSPSRAAILYRRYFGINGTLFVWKVAVLQLMEIALQATAKIGLLGMAVDMDGAVDPRFEPYSWLLEPLYWTFSIGLMMNAVYPVVLLRSKRRFLQRDAVAVIDVLIDLTYFVTFFFSMFFANGFPNLVPTAPHLYASNLWPLVHVVTTAHAIETAAVQRRAEAEAHRQSGSQRKQEERAAAARQRLPRWAAAAFIVLAVLAVWGSALVTGDTPDRYPFGRGDACRPCSCSSEAVLESCNIPAKLGVRYLFIDSKGIRGIAPSAFTGLSIETLDLSHNNVSSLPVGALYGLGHLRSLDLSANAVGALGTGVFDAVPLLTTLVLRNNPLAVLRAGTLAGLDELRNLFLDGSDELRMVEPGAFAGAPRVAHVWMAGSALNCTRLGLPGGVTCFDEVSCDVRHITWIGNRACDSIGGYDTAVCAWDGGDCA
jgi:hypothetical protein